MKTYNCSVILKNCENSGIYLYNNLRLLSLRRDCYSVRKSHWKHHSDINRVFLIVTNNKVASNVLQCINPKNFSLISDS